MRERRDNLERAEMACFSVSPPQRWSSLRKCRLTACFVGCTPLPCRLHIRNLKVGSKYISSTLAILGRVVSSGTGCWVSWVVLECVVLLECVALWQPVSAYLHKPASKLQAHAVMLMQYAGAGPKFWHRFFLPALKRQSPQELIG